MCVCARRSHSSQSLSNFEVEITTESNVLDGLRFGGAKFLADPQSMDACGVFVEMPPGKIVTPASQTVREGTADSPPGIAQIFIWMDV